MKWFILGDPELKKHMDKPMQQSSCEVSGEVFIRPITGKYKDKPVDEVKETAATIMSVLHDQGCPVALDPEQPIWVNTEFLENLYDFELHPPCGCESKMRRQ